MSRIARGYLNALIAMAATAACIAIASARTRDEDDGAALRAEHIAHVLEYLDADYGRTGASEQSEHLALADSATLLARDLPRSPELQRRVADVGALIRSMAPAPEVHAQVAVLRMDLLGGYRVDQSPNTTPSVARGRVLYEHHCAACHGVTGRADTQVAATLRPHPANFREALFGETLSPYDVTTAIRFGVDGTAMAAQPSLGATDRWDVAFYVLGLRHPGAMADDAPSFTSSELALVSDRELRAELFAAGVGGASLQLTLDALRRRTPFEGTRREPLAVVRRDLDAARVGVVRGERRAALAAVLSARDDGAGPTLGATFAKLADLVRSGAPPTAVVATLDNALELVTHAEHAAGAHHRPDVASVAWPQEGGASTATNDVAPQGPCSEPGFGPGPGLRATEGDLPFDVTHDCMFPGNARLEIALDVRQDRRPRRAQVDALLRDLFEQVRAETGKSMPDLTHICAFPARTTDSRRPYGCLEFEADDGPQGEFAVQVDIPFEAAEWASTFAANRSAGFVGPWKPQVTVDESRPELEVTYPFVDPGTGKWSDTVTMAEATIRLFPWLFDFYPPRTDVQAIAFRGIRRGRPWFTVRVADLKTFLSMDPWPIRERMAAAGIPIDPDAPRTPAQQAILAREYASALAKLPKGGVLFDGAMATN